MARYYRRKRRTKSTKLQDAVIVLVFGLVILGTIERFANAHPYIVALFIVLAISVLALILALWWQKRERARHVYEAYTLANIDSMDGLEFEKYVADLLRRRGFTRVSLTERFDLGIDVVAHKDGITWGVQVKRYSGTVKAAAVRQVYTALARYKCNRAMVISNSTYSRPAKLLAEDTNSALVEREELSQWIYEASAKPNRKSIWRL